MKFFSDYTRFIIFLLLFCCSYRKQQQKQQKLWENRKNR